MITFPNCKINLGLHILRKRDDGYHDLESVLYPLPVQDVLEVITNQDVPGSFQLIQSGLPVNGHTGDNLCTKAFRLLQKNGPGIPSIRLLLHKNIPMGAGLGGGSADAAFTLQLLNEKYQLHLSTEQLLEYSLQLGSDCPFFIINTPCLAGGRGELLQQVDLDLSTWSFLLVYPGIHIPTAWAFSQLSPALPARPIGEIIQQPVEQWKQHLVNDFEKPVCKAYPSLQSIKDTLYGCGAVYASMTGSGSAFYGIFKKDQLPVIQWPAGYTVFSVK